MLITPVDETVTRVLVPPVVKSEFEVVATVVIPAIFKIPLISPVLPDPEKTIEIVLAVFVNNNELPFSITKSFPGPPVIVIILCVAALD